MRILIPTSEPQMSLMTAYRLLFAACLAIASCSKAPESSRATAQVVVAPLKDEKLASPIQKVRLGMTEAEVRSLFPDIKTTQKPGENRVLSQETAVAIPGRAISADAIQFEFGKERTSRDVLHWGLRFTNAGLKRETIYTALCEEYGQPLAHTRSKAGIELASWRRGTERIRFHYYDLYDNDPSFAWVFHDYYEPPGL
jgi:hypothetical protein